VPFKPDKGTIIMLSVSLGLFVGVLLAFLRRHLDRTFNGVEDVEARLALPVLGSLHRLVRRRGQRAWPERWVLAEPRSTFAESINDIRTALLFSRVDDPPKVLLVTSAVAGEGKTTLASNLALALCKRGRTLLVDGDLRRGRVEQIYDAHDRPGLTDLISGGATWDDVVVPDGEADGLFMVTAGTKPPNPLEIISSKRFAHGLAELRERYEHVVIDGSPVLPVSDSVVLGHLVDGVLMVIQAGKTTHDMAQEAARRLESANVVPIGVVLQQVDLRRARRYGYRYAGYGGGYYAYGSPHRR
jgi:capsular exopolysaccharide synthesis family protein